jgi:TolA-binding protein
MRTKVKSFIIVVIVGLAVPIGARAQEAPPAPATSPEPATSDEASDEAPLDEQERPEAGPGSVIRQSESVPPPPPTSAEIEGVSGFEAELAFRQRELERFQLGAEEFAEDLRDQVRLQYEAQKASLALQFDKAIEELEEEERRRRLEAIARFEAFIEKYPNDPTYTPDAMFRLAELYFERSSDEYLLASRRYEDELLAWDEERRETEPTEPEPNYEQTIAMHGRLLREFPNYRFADAARYLLGYAYSEQDQTDRALQAYMDLTELHPTSSFLPEVWTRIGEIYFDRSDVESLENAIAAYSRVEAFPDSPYYDKALYKIAWTYYRLDRYDEAVSSFIRLIDYADAQKELTGISGSELRSEAIQYVAISLADDAWGGLGRAQQVLAPIQDEDYAGEIWMQYGQVLFDQTRYDPAIQVLGYAIARYPTNAKNPQAQELIVRAYEQQRDFAGATRAREKLVADYSGGSAWYVANQEDEDAIRQAESLTERSLYTAAIFRHRQAQAYKAEGRVSDSRENYGAAAAAYQQYLDRFPKSSNAYDFEFYLAECLFYSGEFASAASQYESVRDSTVNNKHLEAAALSAVITYEKLVEEQVKRGSIPKYPLDTAAERQGRPVEPKGLAEIRSQLVDASDRFLTLIPDGERSPAIAYRAAEVYYRHDQFPEARRRFETIVAQYPTNEVARYASNLIIESYLAVEDWESVEKVSNRLMKVAKSSETDDIGREEFVGQLQLFKVGAQFKQAENYDAAGEYEQAADTYVRLVDENPEHEFADKALFNAAIAYEKVKRFDSASKVYDRIYNDYPKSDLAPRALFRVGINAEKGFDFDNAVSAYQRLAQRYPNSENRADAMYNLAVVLENNQDYEAAAGAYRRYATEFPRREDAGEVYFRTALVYEKMEDWPRMIETLQSFIGSYSRSASQRERLVLAYRKIGDAEKARERLTAADRAYGQCLTQFRRSGLTVRSRAGADAANCAFERAEAKFRAYDAIEISGTGRRQVQALQRKAKAQREVEQAYRGVFDYKRVETTLAASYRIGHSYERFAESLFTAPIPKEFESDEDLAMEYKMQLEERAGVLERKAETAYRKAYEEARRTKVTNQWTRRTLEGLNKYSPQEFPIQKQGKAMIQTAVISGRGLDPGAQAEAPPPAEAAPDAPPPGSGPRTGD